MKLSIPVVETINKRHSTRSFEHKNLSLEDREKLLKYIPSLSNPFGADVKFHIAEKQLASNGEKLGTYGIIKGASTFLGVSISKNKFGLLAAGYEFENLILYATNMGLATVWLAATFSRKDFIKAMHIDENDQFIAISPVGYPAKKLTIQDKLMRKALKSSTRKPWQDIFFYENFNTALTSEIAGSYATALEMLRLAPSATNAQPWRVIKSNNMYHFYITYKSNTSEKAAYIKQVDLGIALSHFHQTTLELNLNGYFKQFDNIDINAPKDFHYIISWIDDSSSC